MLKTHAVSCCWTSCVFFQWKTPDTKHSWTDALPCTMEHFAWSQQIVCNSSSCRRLSANGWQVHGNNLTENLVNDDEKVAQSDVFASRYIGLSKWRLLCFYQRFSSSTTSSIDCYVPNTKALKKQHTRLNRLIFSKLSSGLTLSGPTEDTRMFARSWSSS